MVNKLGRVLVVDDEEIVRSLLQQTLERANYDVVIAASGQEALDKVAETEFDAVLLDMKMPGMSGLEVLQQLTAHQPHTCVLMVTAVGDAETAIEAMKFGAYDYIIKPFNPDDVALKLRSALVKRSQIMENEHNRLDLEKKVGEQTQRLQQQFAELVETLAREHKLLYSLAERQRGGVKSLFSKLPKELQEPMSSVEEFSEALVKILRKGALKTSDKAAADDRKAPE
ncbi:sigma-54-dependent transcriptional regulator [Chloroflexota bacterium]